MCLHPFIELWKSTIKPTIGLGFIWRCSDILMRCPNILMVSIHKIASCSDTIEYLNGRELLFLKFVRTCANVVADKTFCCMVERASRGNILFGHRLDISRRTNRRGFLSCHRSGHQRTSLRMELHVLDFLEPFSTQILNTNLPNHKFQRNLFWANRLI